MNLKWLVKNSVWMFILANTEPLRVMNLIASLFLKVKRLKTSDTKKMNDAACVKITNIMAPDIRSHFLVCIDVIFI